MEYRKIIKGLLLEIIYVIAVCIYWINISALNTELIKNTSTAYEVLKYDNGIAMKYFFIALVIVIISAIAVFLRFKHMLDVSSESTEEIFVVVISILILVIGIFIVVNSISIPILKSIIIVSLTGFGLVAGFSSK